MVWIDFLIYIFGESETFIALCPLRVAVDTTKEGIVKIEHQQINWMFVEFLISVLYFREKKSG